MKTYCTYLRVSTKRQGKSGLGLDAQRKMCADFINAQGGELAQEFIDVESGTHRDRKGLQQAINFCKQNKCPLVIAKLDRLARDVEFCFKVVNTGIEIHFTDMLQMNTLLLGVFASVAQYERELTSDRTKKALAVKKRHGCLLGASNETYKANYANKSEQEKKAIGVKRGCCKRERFHQSKDVQTFLRCIKRVQPEHCVGDDVTKWEWRGIDTKCGRRIQILTLMKDYKEFDTERELFVKWDLDGDLTSTALANKLCAYMQCVRKSFIGV